MFKSQFFEKVAEISWKNNFVFMKRVTVGQKMGFGIMVSVFDKSRKRCFYYKVWFPFFRVAGLGGEA